MTNGSSILRRYLRSNVSKLLQLENNFSLPTHLNKKIVIHESYHKRYRKRNKKCKIKQQLTMRNKIILHIYRFLHTRIKKNIIEETLISAHRSTQLFLKNNPDIIFIRADNITVAMKKTDYIKKMEVLLNDKMTYSIVKKNPIQLIERQLNNILKG